MPAGFKIAQAIIADGRLSAFVKERYESWDCELGRRVESGKASFSDLEAYILPKGDAAKNVSGRHCQTRPPGQKFQSSIFQRRAGPR